MTQPSQPLSDMHMLLALQVLRALLPNLGSSVLGLEAVPAEVTEWLEPPQPTRTR